MLAHKITATELALATAIKNGEVAKVEALCTQMDQQIATKMLYLALAQRQNAVFKALLNKFPDLAKKDAVRNGFFRQAVKLNNSVLCEFLLNATPDAKALTSKSKKAAKVWIKAVAFRPATSTDAMLQLLGANSKARELLPEEPKMLIKQVSIDLEDKSELQDTEQARIRAVRSILASLDGAFRKSLKSQLKATTKDAEKPTEYEKIEEKFREKLAKLKKKRASGNDTVSIDSEIQELMAKTDRSKNAIDIIIGDVPVAEVQDDFKKLVMSIKSNDTNVAETMLSDEKILATFTPAQANAILYDLITYWRDDLLELVLEHEPSKQKFAASVAGDLFRNRLLCLAIDTGNLAAVQRLLTLASVKIRMQQKAKDVVKVLIQTVATLPVSETAAIVKAMCDTAEFRSAFAQNAVAMVVLNELGKEKGADTTAAVALLLNEVGKRDLKIVRDFLQQANALADNNPKDYEGAQKLLATLQGNNQNPAKKM